MILVKDNGKIKEIKEGFDKQAKFQNFWIDASKYNSINDYKLFIMLISWTNHFN